MIKLAAMMVALLAPAASAAVMPKAWDARSEQITAQREDTRIGAPVRLAMGPDPGGHTGAGVTPTTTKSGQTGDNNQGAGQSQPSGPTSGGSQPSKPESGSARTDNGSSASSSKTGNH